MATDRRESENFMDMYRRNAGYLYRIALCFGGSAPEAERILCEALWNAFRRHGVIRKRSAFRRAVVNRMQLNPAGGRPMRSIEPVSEAGEAFLQMEPSVQRAIILHWECDWSVKQAAKGLGLPVSLLQRRLNTLENLPGGDSLPGEIHSDLLKSSAPDMSRILRDFSGRAAGWKRPRHWIRKTLKTALKILLAAVCLALFWLIAVLLEG